MKRKRIASCGPGKKGLEAFERNPNHCHREREGAAVRSARQKSDKTHNRSRSEQRVEGLPEEKNAARLGGTVR